MANEIIGNQGTGDGAHRRGWPAAATREDEMAMERINQAYETIEMAVRIARKNMAAGGRPDLVGDLFQAIEFAVHGARGLAWPDPQARLAEAARRDSGVQKLIKKASRKTPI